MAGIVNITVRVPMMVTMTVSCEEEIGPGNLADALHIAAQPDCHLRDDVKILHMAATDSVTYLSEERVNPSVQLAPFDATTAPESVKSTSPFDNVAVPGQLKAEALKTVANLPSKTLVMGFNSKKAEDPHLVYLSTPLDDDEARIVFDSLVEKDLYGCVIVINGNSLIKRQKVAVRGGWEVHIHRKNESYPEIISWKASRSAAVGAATDVLQRDGAQKVSKIDIVDFTNREKGAITWKTVKHPEAS